MVCGFEQVLVRVGKCHLGQLLPPIVEGGGATAPVGAGRVTLLCPASRSKVHLVVVPRLGLSPELLLMPLGAKSLLESLPIKTDMKP